jgi:tetraacyldisaccharide 4'-kinase
VAGSGDGRALAAFAGHRVHALAGIGNPARFFNTLRAGRLEPIEHPFPDHHRYIAQDLRFDDGLALIMTEKDAVKCQAFAPENCWYLPVTATFSGAEGRALLGRILMDARLLDILACPVCKGPLRLVQESAGPVLVCRADRLAYPVREGIPVMLEEAARQLSSTDPLMER